LAQRLGNYSAASERRCTSISPDEQVARFMYAGRQACQGDTSKDCDLFSGAANSSDSGGAQASAEDAAQALASMVRHRALAIDYAVVNATQLLNQSIMGDLNHDVFSHVVALTNSLECGFLRRAIVAATDGVCLEGMVGLIRLRNALFTLGLLCIAMSIVMYFLWLRLVHHRALAVAHYEGSKRAASGGRPVDLSEVSRKLARGETLTSMSSVGSPRPSQKSPPGLAEASPMESGVLFGGDLAEAAGAGSFSQGAGPSEEILADRCEQASPIIRRNVSQRSVGGSCPSPQD